MKFGKMSDSLSASGESEVMLEKAAAELEEKRFQQMITVISDLSNSIKQLAVATASQRSPMVVNLISSSDEDLNKFATIFAQGIK